MDVVIKTEAIDEPVSPGFLYSAPQLIQIKEEYCITEPDITNTNKKRPLRRKFISLQSKIQILNRLEEGEKVSAVAKSLNLNEATIRTIKKNQEKIRTAVAAGSSVSANVTARPRAPIMEKMERALSIWIDDCSKKQRGLDSNVIKQRALKIYHRLKENGESPVNPDFVASKGWFERFKNRFSLNNNGIQRENPSMTNNGTNKIKEITEEQGYNVFGSRTEFSESLQGDGFDDEDGHHLLIEKNSSEADLVEMVKEVNKIKSEKKNVKRSKFTLESIEEGLNLAQQLESYFLNADPSIKRSGKFKNQLKKCLTPYQKIYKNLTTRREDSSDTGDMEQERKLSRLCD